MNTLRNNYSNIALVVLLRLEITKHVETRRQGSECKSQSIRAIKGALEHYKIFISFLSGYNQFLDIDYNDPFRGRVQIFFFTV